MKMRIEEAKWEDGQIVVRTTGAEFTFLRKEMPGKVRCLQRVGCSTLRANVSFCDVSFEFLELQHHDEDKVVLHLSSTSAGFVRIEINADSTMIVYSVLAGLQLFACEGNWQPEYTVHEDGNVLLLDSYGGVGFFWELARGASNLLINDGGWRAVFPVDRFHEFYVSVCPPREVDPERSQDVIVHNGLNADGSDTPYPADAQIEEFARCGNILVLHSGIWKGRMERSPGRFQPIEQGIKRLCLNAQWANFRYEPLSSKEMARVIHAAHRGGMKVIPYVSPYYSTARVEDFMAELERLLNEYDFDGFYFDELFIKNTKDAYHTIRSARKLLGDRLLYVHCSGTSRHLFCPFIDTYADYFLRGEHYYPFDESFLKFYISGHNTSNSIGHICSYDYPLGYAKKLIHYCLRHQARIPIWAENNLNDEHARFLVNHYLPELRLMLNGRYVFDTSLEPLAVYERSKNVIAGMNE